VVAFEEALVSFFVTAAGMLGVPKSVAAIYGICFASAEPLGFSEIAARLDISAGSISQGLRVLREMGALKVMADASVSGALPHPAVSADSRRREFYTPDMELRKLAEHFLEQRLEKQLKAGKERLQEIKAAIPQADPVAATELKARLKYLESWHKQGAAVVPLIRGLLKLT